MFARYPLANHGVSAYLSTHFSRWTVSGRFAITFIEDVTFVSAMVVSANLVWFFAILIFIARRVFWFFL